MPVLAQKSMTSSIVILPARRGPLNEKAFNPSLIRVPVSRLASALARRSPGCDSRAYAAIPPIPRAKKPRRVWILVMVVTRNDGGGLAERKPNFYGERIREGFKGNATGDRGRPP